MPKTKGAGGLYGLTEDGSIQGCTNNPCNFPDAHVQHVQGKKIASEMASTLREAFRLLHSGGGPARRTVPAGLGAEIGQQNEAFDKIRAEFKAELKAQRDELAKEIHTDFNEVRREIDSLLNDLVSLRDSNKAMETKLAKISNEVLPLKVAVREQADQIKNLKAQLDIAEIGLTIPNREDVKLGTKDGIRASAWWVSPEPDLDKRQVVVFQPETSLNRGDWAASAKELARRGFHVLLMDAREFGGRFGFVSDLSAAQSEIRDRGFDFEADTFFVVNQQVGEASDLFEDFSKTMSVTKANRVIASRPENPSKIASDLSFLASAAKRLREEKLAEAARKKR